MKCDQFQNAAGEKTCEWTGKSYTRANSRKPTVASTPRPTNAVSLNYGRRHLNLYRPQTRSSKAWLLVLLAILFFFTLSTQFSTATLTAPVNTSSNQSAIESPDFQKIVEAIRKAENSKKYPYGIRSVRCTSDTSCRQQSERTVRNTYQRWLNAGRPGYFLSFLAARYAPIGAENDPKNLNAHWLKNVRFFAGGAA